MLNHPGAHAAGIYDKNEAPLANGGKPNHVAKLAPMSAKLSRRPNAAGAKLGLIARMGMNSRV